MLAVEEYPAERRMSTPMLVFQYPRYSGPLANILLDRKTSSIEVRFSRSLHHRYSSTSRFLRYPNFVPRWRHFAGIWPQSRKFDPDFLGPCGAQGGEANIVRYARMFPIRVPNAWIVRFSGGPQSRTNLGYPLFLASTPPPFNLPKVTNGSSRLHNLNDISLRDGQGL